MNGLADTADRAPLFDGASFFELKSAHGLPWDMALDEIVTKRGLAVDWVGVIEAARKNGWWDFQLYESLGHAMVDAELPHAMRSAICQRFQRYVLAHPHPKARPEPPLPRQSPDDALKRFS